MIKRLPGSHHLVTPTAAELAALPWLALVKWCYKTARYGLVTRELVEWLKEAIGGRKAVEVAAGQGDLGFALGIPMSDMAVQTTPEMTLLYTLAGQATTSPPPDVERIHAMQALAKYKPQVVVASWMTQKWVNGDTEKSIGSSVYGVDECRLIGLVETYIHIGNVSVHHDKRALTLPHKEYAFPWLWSRAQQPELNRIWVWDKASQK